MIAVYTITSGLHDEASVARLSEAFLGSIFPKEEYLMRGADFSDFGTHTLDLIYVRTGGAEGIFRQLLPGLLARGAERFLLLTSGRSNSLAASLEILSFLQQQGLRGEVLHGSEEYLCRRIHTLATAAAAREKLRGTRIGVIGAPSDWLIASHADPQALSDKLGLTLEDIPMEALLAAIEQAPAETEPELLPMVRDVHAAWPGASRIHKALQGLVTRHGLGALTLRCFDLLTAVHNTGCLALARLNAEGIPASCEGDIPALLSMMIAQALTGKTGFQTNPARIDPDSGEMLFAHCTVPFNLVRDWTLDTHFESGIGIGIHGELPEGPVTVFKVSGDLRRHFAAEGTLVRNQYEQHLCRTQAVLQLSPDDARYFLTRPIGNHHILLPGHHRALLEEFCVTCN